MQLLIATNVTNIHGVDLKNSHVLLLQGRNEDRSIANLPRLYSLEKPNLTSKDIPYMSEKLRYMAFSDREREHIHDYQRANFGNLYDQASGTVTPLPGGWLEFDDQGNIADSSSDPVDIFTRLSQNCAAYTEATALISPHHWFDCLMVSQLLHQHMNIQAPVFFVNYYVEDDRAAAAFKRRHETPWVDGSIVDLNAKKAQTMLFVGHWFRENSYVVFGRLLMEAFEHPEREFHALTPLNLQILFYLKKEAGLSLQYLIDQVNFTNDEANSLADNLPANFSLHTAIDELAQRGFIEKYEDGAHLALSGTGMLLMRSLFDTCRMASSVKKMLREKQELGLIMLDAEGGERNTSLGDEYDRQLAHIKNTTGLVSVMRAIRMLLKKPAFKTWRLPIQEIESVFNQKKDVARFDVKLSTQQLVEYGLVNNDNERFSLTTNGQSFVDMLHPKTLDHAAFGRINRWIEARDMPAIKQYINTIFGRQLRYSQRHR